MAPNADNQIGEKVRAAQNHWMGQLLLNEKRRIQCKEVDFLSVAVHSRSFKHMCDSIPCKTF